MVSFKNISNIFLIILTVSLLPSLSSFGQKHIDKLKKWDEKEKYKKVIRKSEKFAKKFPDDPKIYYYASSAGLKLSLKNEQPNKGYKHLLTSISNYEKYTSNSISTQVSKSLSTELYLELKYYHQYYQEKNKKKPLQTINTVLNTTFRDIKISDNELNKVRGFTEKEKTPKIETQTNDKLRQKVIAEAKKHVGKPYLYGAKGPNSFDCSGFTVYVYRHAFNFDLPPNSVMQSKLGKQVSIKDTQLGDLIFFGDPITKNINHVGIVTNMANEEVTGMIHSSSSRGVIIDHDNETWNLHWKKRIVKIVNIVDFAEKK